MNTTFNFSRFLKVLRNEWRLNLKKMVLFWGGMIIITVLYFAVNRINVSSIDKTTTFGLLFFMMCIMQGFYLQNYYHEFSSKTKTQALLLLPASRNETFWAKFTLGVLFYLVFFSVYVFIVIKCAGIYNDWIKEIANWSFDSWRYRSFEQYQTLTIDSQTKQIFFLFWLFSVSVYLPGILSFKKLAALKSLVFWFGVVMGLVLLTCVVYALFTGVWPRIAIPGILIETKTVAGSNYCAIIQMYPELLYGLGIFICLALIAISRVKYNEKTI